MATRIVHEVRRGRITARIRRKQTRSGVRHSISVVRLFRNGDHWKESTRFGRDDIPVVCLVLDLAHTWVLQHCTSGNQSSTNR